MPKEKRKSLSGKSIYNGEFSLNSIFDEETLKAPDSGKKLKIQKAVFESLFNLSPEGIAILNSNFEVIYCNLEFLRIFGYGPSEVKGKLIYELVTPKELLAESHKFIKEIFSGAIIKTETKRRTKSGKTIDVSFIGKKIVLDESHSVIYTIYRDITEKKEFENSLLKEKSYLRALMDNMPDTIYFKDLNSRFTNVNKAQIKLLGAKSIDEALGKTDFDFFTKEHAKIAYEDEQKIIKTGTQLISKLENLKTPSGSKRWYIATKVPIYDNSGKNVIGIVGISRDIHELESAKEELRKTAEKLKMSNASKDKFFSIIAHDLKNPFNSLLGLSQLLLADFNELTNDEIKEMIEGISDAAESSYHLLENLLQWSKTQIGRIQFEPEKLNINDVFREESATVVSLAKAKQINLQVRKCKDKFVYADKNMLQTILRNILTNSIKFTPKGGMVRVSCREDGDCFELVVEDTGVGMDKETVENLFNPDTLHSRMGTADEKGSGIGLLICDEFVKRHNGKIVIDSEVGKGSKFTCIFPNKIK